MPEISQILVVKELKVYNSASDLVNHDTPVLEIEDSWRIGCEDIVA